MTDPQDGQILLDAAPIADLAEPMTVDEIDAHPDAARIWAIVRTMSDLREIVEDEMRAEMNEIENERDAIYQTASDRVDDLRWTLNQLECLPEDVIDAHPVLCDVLDRLEEYR